MSIATVVIAGAALAACSPDGAGTPGPVTVTVTSSAPGAGAPVAAPSDSAVPGPAEPTSTKPKGPEDVVKPTTDGTVYFHSPSGTFHCAIFGNSPGLSDLYRAGCQGESAVQSPAEQECRTKWGPVGAAMVLRVSGHGEFECQNQGVFVGGTTADGSGTGKVVRPVLAYGERAAVGPVSCEMAVTGVTCTDSRTGGGFTMSREGHRGF